MNYEIQLVMKRNSKSIPYLTIEGIIKSQQFVDLVKTMIEKNTDPTTAVELPVDQLQKDTAPGRYPQQSGATIKFNPYLFGSFIYWILLLIVEGMKYGHNV